MTGTPDPGRPGDEFDRRPASPPARRWRTFTDWIDRHAWTIIVVGVSLILLDVLVILALVILLQVAR